MRLHVRGSLLAVVTGVLVALVVPAFAQAAEEAPSIEKFAAVNCKAAFPDCAHKTETLPLPEPLNKFFGPQKYSITSEPGEGEAKTEGFVQAGGHVPFGVTDFTLAHEGSLPAEKPKATIKHLRTDVAPGLATSPVAIDYCSQEQYGVEELPGSELFTAPKCPEKGGKEETRIGLQQATVYVAALGIDLGLEGPVFNLEPPAGKASLYGISVPLPIALTKGELEKSFAEHPPGPPFPQTEPEKKLAEEHFETKQWYSHSSIEGNVEWGKEAAGTGEGDYHDYFESKVSTALPLVSSRLVFFGTRGGHFITNGTACPGHDTTRLFVENQESKPGLKSFTTPIGLENCKAVPFETGFLVTPGTTQQDQPDEFTAEATVAHHFGENEIDASQLKVAEFALPEGMTLNPAAAAGLSACTPAQARIHSSTAGVACPASSEIGTVNLDVPTLPPGSLTGKLYLGGPETGPITGPPFTMYVDAESARYGVSVRLRAEVVPNETTGQVTTIFPENPEQPFSNASFHFTRGALSPIANPLACGVVTAFATFSPTTLNPANHQVSNPFAFDVNGAGGACASPIPLAPTQKTANQTGNAGGHTSYTFTLERPDGQQYFSQISTTMPAGLVGAIPAVTQCPEPQAAQGTCSSASQIGTAVTLAGSGPTPFAFSGPVYLTGPYNGAPFGLSIAVPAVAGPFNLGTVVTRAAINVDQTTGRVIVTSTIPRVFKGVTLRLRRITVAIEKQSFLFNPTNCSPLATESSVTGFVPGSNQSSTVALSTPFQVGNCGALSFKPAFKSATSGKTSRANGASLETTLNMPSGGANVKSVLVQLPPELPSRLSTLQKACPEKTFAINPLGCPDGSYVGGVRANTPTLPTKLQGPAVLVSHGGAAFPDLDLVLDGDGVRVILVGNTDIKKGITKTHFAATPDVPVSSITVNLPVGPHSALAAFGNLCTSNLVMPTTIEGQNGKSFKQNTKIKLTNCGVQVVGHKVVGHTAYLTVKTFNAGRVSASGSGVTTTAVHFKGAVNAAQLKVQVSSGKRKIRVGFYPKDKKVGTSVTYQTVFVP
jgi:hypothetical protein